MAKRIAWEEFRDRINELQKQSYGAKVDYVPTGAVGEFEKFCKILHPIYEDLSITDSDISWDDFQQQFGKDEETKKLEEDNPEIAKIFEGSTLISGSTKEGAPTKQISWKEVAERYGVEYNASISASSFENVFPRRSWPRYLVRPDEGELEVELLANLLLVLQEVSSNADCLYFAEPWRNENMEPLLLLGDLSVILKYRKLGGYDNSPNLWWCTDNSWFVDTNCDLTYTIVGGSKDLITKIIENPVFEAIEIWPILKS